MRSPNKALFLMLTILVALTSACATSPPPEQRVEAKKETRPQQELTVIAAIVKARKANLRDRPSQTASVVSTVHKGDRLSVTSASPIGPWYQIRDSKTRAEGWIHGNAIALLQTTEPTSSSRTSASTPKPRRISPTASNTSTPTVSSSSRPASGRSYVNVDGVRVPSPVFSKTRPAGATARCRDGSHSFSLNRRGTCSHHGGVAEWY